MGVYLKKYLLEIETLSPVFIGSGDSVGKKEYVYDRKNNRVLFLDMKKMFQGLQQIRKLDAYEDYLLNDYKDLFFFFKDQGIIPKQYKEWLSYEVPLADAGLITKNTKNILTCVKDPYGMAYVPGSSLKGALRTILQSGYYLNDSEATSKMKNRILKAEPDTKKRYLNNEDRQMDVESMHRPLFDEVKLQDQNNDTLRGLIVGDSEPLQKNSLCVVQKVDVTVDGIQKPFPLLRECIAPGSIIRFPITIDRQVCDLKAKDIVEAIKVFYENYYKEFMHAFHVTSDLPKQSPVFFLGGGAGYTSKTCTYAVIHGKEGIKAVSRIIDQTLPFKVKKMHGHHKDASLGASPHMLKCTKHQGKLKQMGACKVNRLIFIKEQ